jgi:CheY-like chemotaxis protein
VSKILVIDDDGTVRAVLGALLGKFGHQAILASNTLDGIAAAESGSIDAVLIDMNMPGLDGLEAVKAIAHLEPRIPIIGMSAGSATTSVEDYAVLAANLGAALFLLPGAPSCRDAASVQAGCDGPQRLCAARL